MKFQIRKLLSLFKTEKKYFWIVLFFLILGVSFPIFRAQALCVGSLCVDILQEISKPFVGALSMVLGLIFGLIASLTSFLLQAATGLFSWVLSENFISLSYTDPARNPFISVGLSITRDLTNLFFVVVMIAIGLGTALRLGGGGYQVKKALPILIIVLLLINFSPVIMGLVVDASNIIMNYFFKGASGLTNFGNQMSTIGKSFIGAFNIFDTEEALSSAFALAAIGGFNVIAAFVYFIFAFLFIMRYVVIWLLVVLSPIAFASYILPATKSIFNKWLNQFFQWSFIGVIAGFFLYLSNRMAYLAANNKLGLGKMSDSGKGFSGVINQVLPWGIVVALMVLGLSAALSSSAKGAGFATGLGKKSAGAIRGFAKKRGMAFTREKTPEGVRRFGQRLAGASTPGTGEKGLWAGVKRATTGGLWSLGRVAGRGITQAVGEAGRKGVTQSAEAEAEKMQDENILLSKIRDELGPGGSTDRAIGLVSGGIKKGKGFKKLLQDSLSSEEAVKLARAANKLGMGSQAEKIARGFIGKIQKEPQYQDPEKIREAMGFGDLSPDDYEKGYKNIIDKLIGEAKGDDLKDFSKNFWKSSEAMAAIQNFWGGSQLRQAADEFGRTFVDDYMEKAEEKGLDWFAQNNKKAALYLAGNAAQDLGYTVPVIQQDIKDKTGNTVARQGELITDRRRLQRIIAGMEKPILSPEEEAFLERRAEIISTERKSRGLPPRNSYLDKAEAVDEYVKFQDEREKAKKDLIELTPKPDLSEIKRFKAIAEGKKAPPIKLNEKSLREVRGTLRESYNIIYKTHREILDKTRKLQESEKELKAAQSANNQAQITESAKKIAELTDDLKDLNLNWGNYQKKEFDLKTQEARIKASLPKIP